MCTKLLHVLAIALASCISHACMNEIYRKSRYFRVFVYVGIHSSIHSIPYLLLAVQNQGPLTKINAPKQQPYNPAVRCVYNYDTNTSVSSCETILNFATKIVFWVPQQSQNQNKQSRNTNDGYDLLCWLCRYRPPSPWRGQNQPPCRFRSSLLTHF